MAIRKVQASATVFCPTLASATLQNRSHSNRQQGRISRPPQYTIPSLISVIGTEMLGVSSGDCNNEPNASVRNFTAQHTRCQRLGSISICKPNLFLIIPYYSVSLLGLWDGVCQESQKQEFQPRLERKHTIVTQEQMHKQEPSDKPKSTMNKAL